MIRVNIPAIWVFIVILLVGCSSDDDGPSLSNTIVAHTFTIDTPKGWQLEELQGFDSYVGVITGGLLFNDVIHFDQGGFNFGGVENIVEDDQTISMAYLDINGNQAIIKKEYDITNQEIDIILTIFIGHTKESKNRLYVYDPKNEELIIEIAKTHRFL